MKSNKEINVAIVGASGLVGQKFIKILQERKFPIKNLFLFASEKSAGDKIIFNGNEYVIDKLEDNSFQKIKLIWHYSLPALLLVKNLLQLLHVPVVSLSIIVQHGEWIKLFR